MGPLHLHNLCLPNFPQAFVLSVSLPVNFYSPCVCLPSTACHVCLACEKSHKWPMSLPPSQWVSLSSFPSALSSHLLKFQYTLIAWPHLPSKTSLRPLARHLLEFLLVFPNSAIDFGTFRNNPP